MLFFVIIIESTNEVKPESLINFFNIIESVAESANETKLRTPNASMQGKDFPQDENRITKNIEAIPKIFLINIVK
jgi:hypothetical protein